MSQEEESVSEVEVEQRRKKRKSKKKKSRSGDRVEKAKKRQWKSKSLEEQASVLSRALSPLRKAKKSAKSRTTRRKIEEGERVLNDRLKLIMIADTKGWQAAKIYDGDCECGSDSEDDRRIRDAVREAGASKRPFRASHSRSNHAVRQPVVAGSATNTPATQQQQQHQQQPRGSGSWSVSRVGNTGTSRKGAPCCNTPPRRLEQDHSCSSSSSSSSNENDNDDKCCAVVNMSLCDELSFQQYELEFDDGCDGRESEHAAMFGRLKKCIKFWEEMGASKHVLKIIEHGYRLPLCNEPEFWEMRNHSSCKQTL